jgi:hypothetical protein
MKRERSDIQFIMWRKRVDMTLLLSGQTPIPTWLVKQWQLKEVFDFSSNSQRGAELLGKRSIRWLY